MKVKIFVCTFYSDLEDKINNFIQDKQVQDIKYQKSRYEDFSALIIYEEEEKK